MKRISLVEALAGFILLWSLMNLLVSALGMGRNAGEIFIILAVCMVLIHILWPHRIKVYASGAVFLIGSGLGWFYVILSVQTKAQLFLIQFHVLFNSALKIMTELFFISHWIPFYKYFMNGIYLGAQVQSAPNVYGDVFIVFFGVLASWGIYQIIFRKVHYGVWFVPVMFFIQQWFVYARRIQVNFVMYLLALLVLTGCQNAKKKMPFAKTLHRSYTVYLIAFGLVTVVLANTILFLFPLKQFNAAIDAFIPHITNMRTGYKRSSFRMFSLFHTPYQPYGDVLGGKVEFEDNPVLFTVHTAKKNIYLRGRVQTSYTGHKWVSDHRTYYNNNDYPIYSEPEYAFEPFHVTIEFRDMQTQTLFMPLGVISVALDRHKVYMNPDGAAYYKRDSFEKTLATYTVTTSGYNSNLEDEQSYLKLPQNFDEKIMNLALDVTSQAHTDFEKMRLIQNYLRKTYRYTLDVNAPTVQKDFVYNFLFEEKEGYCTYFASALATMGRTLGVPTRYVEGFILSDELSESGAYIVRADNAHAWVEAYIDGRGWVVFEATPAYNTVSYQGSQDSVSSNEESVLDDRGLQFQNNIDNTDFKEKMLETLTEKEAVNGESQSFTLHKEHAYILLGILGIIIAGILNLSYIVNRYFRTGTKRQCIIKHIHFIDWLLEKELPLENHVLSVPEKIEVYKVSLAVKNTDFLLGKKKREKDKVMVLECLDGDIIDTLNLVLYGKQAIQKEDYQKVQVFLERLESTLQASYYRIMYWMEKHLEA